MISNVRREHFVAPVEKFVSKKLSADAFARQFTVLWMQYRNQEVDKKRAAWPEPYDQQMIAAFQRGEMSAAEFQSSSLELWGIDSEELVFQNMINALHSAFSVFSPSPKLEGEITEEQLRQEATEFLVRYQNLKKMPILQTV